MLSVSPNSLARSSLEEMLDSLRQRDENLKPKDMPPALPSRPRSISRSRLPSTRNTTFHIEESDSLLCNGNVKKDGMKGLKRGSFGVKKVKEIEPGESPYIMEPSGEEDEIHNDNVGYFMKKKLRVWCRRHNCPWESGHIQSTSGEKASVLLSDGSVVRVPTQDLVPANPDILEGVDDLVQLSYLNEPSVLQNLQDRYSQDVIYSKAGPVLLALNPFKDVQLYGNDFVTAYRQKLLDSPHVYAIADTAYNEMMTGVIHYFSFCVATIVNFADGMNQSIIISGESGAGKTETAKIAMQYFSALGGGSGGIETEVLQTSCILEAFGNAKTSRNDNSSRFGKLIEIHFSATGKICGARIQTSTHDDLINHSQKDTCTKQVTMAPTSAIATTPLLHAPSLFPPPLIPFLPLTTLSRTSISCSSLPRHSSHLNYFNFSNPIPTIFSPSPAAAVEALKIRKQREGPGRLRLKHASDYNYLNQSDCLEIHDVDDADKFRILMGALNAVGFSKEEQEHAFEMLSAVLWLGNISFLVIDDENHVEAVADEAITNAAGLIGCGDQDLMLALSTHRTQAEKDKVAESRLTLQQATDARDSLAKFIYTNLFDWIVEKISLSLAMGKEKTGRCINILDIFGFESFKKNSFEQFCINYANERLQQHFNRHLFKLEQEESELDGIDWTKVDFEDNQDCLDLYEKKPIGLISLLDEESSFPEATDLTFANKLKQHLDANQFFKGERGGAFSVRHYAGEVLYDTEEFLEKNRDPLHFEAIQLLSLCTSRLPQLFASKLLKNSQNPAGSMIQLGMSLCQKQSVATKFKGQLFKLLQQLECTRPHFICCIKPNSKQIPGAFEKNIVLEQLRCCGILEMVRVSRSGYPTRMTHQEFTRRYGFLLQENNTCGDPLSTSVAILQQFDILPDRYQVGYRKLYFRAGQCGGVQIGALENVRKQVLQGTLEVQKCFRGHRERQYFHDLKGTVVTLQSYVRGEIARKDYGDLLRFKRQCAPRKLDEQLMAVVHIQSVIRGWLVQKHVRHLRNSKQSNVSKRKPGRRISEAKGALNAVGFSKEEQEHAFEMLSAVLWLGNISFLVIDDENHVEAVADEAITNAAGLIGCGDQDLMLALSTHRTQAEKDKVAESRLTLQQATDARDSLAKFIYTNLFDWIVEKISLSLAMGKEKTGRCINILDIFGFESFKKNSFEQFCINYANERLQQHFNRHLFKLEQEECELDGIDWTKVDFEDNQDCLDLYEKKPIGLISLLDEESSFPEATDLTFANKLKQHLDANHCFKGERVGAFSVRHYAGEVLYDTEEFLEKNRDPLHFKAIQLLSLCTSRLPQLFASKLLKNSQNPAGSMIQLGMSLCQKQSVATKFKGQLFKLLQQLECTRPHFICCIKPNSKQIPGAFEKYIVLEQLRCCGILEMVRVSRSGYPTRMTHQEFTRRYGFLLQENNTCEDPLSTSVAILQQFDILPDRYQVGYRKLYFRAGQIGALENVRKQVLQGTLEVQKCFRGHRERQYFHDLKGTVVTLQSYVRGEIARKEYGDLLRFERQCAPRKLDEQLMAVVHIQSVIRGWLVQKHVRHLRNSKQSNVSKRKPGRRISEAKDLPLDMLPSVVEELRSKVSMAELTLGQKEKENAALREQVQQFEARMKSMEDMWQKQMASLQMSLAAAKKSLGADNTQTPGGSTDTNGGLNTVGPLAKEFEQRKQTFDEALATVEVKPEELRKLKQSFTAWKKDYKARLRKTKGKIHKQGGHPETEKHRRKWNSLVPHKVEWGDEIEAPMWADLTLEFDSTYEDKDDEYWFHISHPIHQCSAKQLKSLEGPSSPKLPPSVSKSRGKDYKTKMMQAPPVACGLTLNKFKTLSNKSSFIVDLVPKRAIESKAFNGNVKSSLDSKSSKSVWGFSGKTTSSKSIITSEVTRKASRVEIKGMKQSEGRKSCSSKSSIVGSSSLHPQCDGTNQNQTDYKNKTSVRRNEMIRSRVISTNKVNRSNICKAHGVPAKKSSCNSNLHISREPKKTMDLTRANVTREVNICVLPKVATKSTKARGVDYSSTIEQGGKENQAGKIVLGINSSITKLKKPEPEGDNRVIKRKVVQKSDRTKVPVPKVHLFAFSSLCS
ncbi:hypothetical protein RD792_006943 [Penstemon davidsonii]|uniref:Uncharacterized protein n=2 Tax=Magnoliopsida TaxID=3398 RepID=A0ABR0D506_9LAMI|nr:hypothetical protein RD792_006943 [Penstemon davidsonii]